MIFFMIMLIIAIFVWIYNDKHGVQIATILAIVGLAVPFAIAIFCTYDKTVKIPISAINDSHEYVGHFLGSGDTEERYYYVVGNATNGYNIKYIESSDVTIYEIDGAPYLEQKYLTTGNDLIDIIFLSVLSSNSNEDNFYVPHGTVTTDFNVDLE